MKSTTRTIDDLIAEYKMGFVVGDKDVKKHFKDFKQDLLSTIKASLPEKKGLGSEYQVKKIEWKLGYNGALHDVEDYIDKLFNQGDR